MQVEADRPGACRRDRPRAAGVEIELDRPATAAAAAVAAITGTAFAVAAIAAVCFGDDRRCAGITRRNREPAIGVEDNRAARPGIAAVPASTAETAVGRITAIAAIRENTNPDAVTA